MAQAMKIKGFPDSSAGKESTCKVGDLGSIPGLGRSPGGGKTTHSSILAWRIPWTVWSMGSQRVGHDWETHFLYFIYFHMKIMIKLGQGIWKKEKQLDLLVCQTTGNSLLDFHFHEHCMDICNSLLPQFCLSVSLKKEMATHFSTAAWKIPWTEEPGRLWSVGSQRVGHDWTTDNNSEPGEQGLLSLSLCSLSWAHFTPLSFPQFFIAQGTTPTPGCDGTFLI